MKLFPPNARGRFLTGFASVLFALLSMWAFLVSLTNRGRNEEVSGGIDLIQASVSFVLCCVFVILAVVFSFRYSSICNHKNENISLGNNLEEGMTNAMHIIKKLLKGLLIIFLTIASGIVTIVIYRLYHPPSAKEECDEMLRNLDKKLESIGGIKKDDGHWSFPANSDKKTEHSEKYVIGMTMEEAQKLMSQPYRALPSSIKYLEGKEQKEKEAAYMIMVQDEGVCLEFNYYKKVIAIKPYKVPPTPSTSNKPEHSNR